MKQTKDLSMYPDVATTAWLDKGPRDPEGFIITPWNLLQCYLESALQVEILAFKFT